MAQDSHRVRGEPWPPKESSFLVARYIRNSADKNRYYKYDMLSRPRNMVGSSIHSGVESGRTHGRLGTFGDI